MIPTQNGPVEQHARLTGKSMTVIENDARKGEPGAVALLAAEVVYAAVMNLTAMLERPRATKDSEYAPD